MDLRVVFYVLARLTLAASGVLVLPCALALSWGEGEALRAFGLTLLFGIALVWLLSPLFRPPPDDSSSHGNTTA